MQAERLDSEGGVGEGQGLQKEEKNINEFQTLKVNLSKEYDNILHVIPFGHNTSS